ncbi:renalase-like [Uloborus diversus]|uniref:renalase-like n=1 Tax=Uloborus diversus TaxID=327109 RepID=UPI002409CAC9|nr:renalase-like [Uloborus diversus]
MCTSRNSLGSSLDLGAQFISRSSILTSFQERCYEELLEVGILKPLPQVIEGLKSTSAVTEHYICPKGSGSIIKHFLKPIDGEILFGHKVIKVFSSNNKWRVICDNNSTQEFDAVIFTIPVPQILQIEGLTSYISNDELEKLKMVQYSSRFAVGLFYDKSDSFFQNLPWIAKFISDNPVLRFCSFDNQKRGDDHSTPTVVFHSTKEFGKKNIDNDLHTVQKLFFEKIEELLPNIPKANDVKFHKWRYSQVENAYPGATGSLVISNQPLLIAGGDGFSYSTFEGCIMSAEEIVQRVTTHLK